MGGRSFWSGLHQIVPVLKERIVCPRTNRKEEIVMARLHIGHSLVLLLKCCFTSTETVGLLGTGAQDGHLDFHTAAEPWPFFHHSLLLLRAEEPPVCIG